MSGDASADSLNEFDPATGRTSSWPLPATDHNGFLEQVAVAPDGSIWLTEEYQILRLDPSLSTFKSITLPVGDRDAAPHASSPGTWPSAIAFDPQGRAVIGRHNVAALSIFDDSINEVGRISLPPGMYGTNSIATTPTAVIVTSFAANRTVELSWNGSTVSDLQRGFAQIVAESGSVLAPDPGGMVVDLASADTTQATASGGPNDRIATGANTVATYDSGLGSIQWFGADNPTVRQGTFQLSMSTGQVMSPAGHTVTVVEVDEIGAIAVDSTGSIWMVDNSTQQLLQIN